MTGSEQPGTRENILPSPGYGSKAVADLSEEQQIEAEDDNRSCVRRGSEEEMKPRKRQRKIVEDEE